MAGSAALLAAACGVEPVAGPREDEILDRPATGRPGTKGGEGDGGGATTSVGAGGGSQPPAPAPRWSRRFGGDGADRALGVAGIDTLHVVGSFTETALVGGELVTSAGATDALLTTWSEQGTPGRPLRFGGAGTDRAEVVAIDASGSIMLAGGFEETIDFGGDPLVSAGNEDVFVTRLEADGTLMWDRRFGSASSTQRGHGIAFDVACNIVVTGRFEGVVDFGAGPVASAGGSDAFVVKLDQYGAFAWARRFGGAGDDAGLGVAIDYGEAIYVTGQGDGICDDGSPGRAFAMKLDPDGNVAWTRCLGPGATEAGTAIAVEGGGAATVVGRFAGIFELSDGTHLGTAGDDDAFVAKLDPSGHVVWAHQFGDAAAQRATSVAVDLLGDVHLAGLSDGAVDLGDGWRWADGPGFFVGRFDPTGTLRGSWFYGGAAPDSQIAVAAPFDAGTVAVGDFAGTIDLGDGPVTAHGPRDGFVVALPAIE